MNGDTMVLAVVDEAAFDGGVLAAALGDGVSCTNMRPEPRMGP
jgi:hypothetical protein